jgi:hypothetical protein
MKLQPIAKLADAARDCVGNKLPDETHQSFGIPRAWGETPTVCFLYGLSHVRVRDGLYLHAPEQVSRLNAETGELIALEPIEPANFGQRETPRQAIGKYDMLRAVRSPEEYLELLRGLHEAYDLLMPCFFDPSSAPSPEARAAAAQFEAVFRRLSEEQLWPYYAVLGHDFFAWLKKVTAEQTT